MSTVTTAGAAADLNLRVSLGVAEAGFELSVGLTSPVLARDRSGRGWRVSLIVNSGDSDILGGTRRVADTDGDLRGRVNGAG